MADVFISYKKQDADWARRVGDGLRAEGFSVFWDDNLGPDKAWDERLEEELQVSRSVVVLWSPRSVASTWVRTEAHVGQDHGKLVPVMIEACELPLAFRLTQTLDLSAWSGDREHRHWRKLATWIADLAAARAGIQEAAGHSPSDIAARQRAVIGSLKSSEPVWDGATISFSTPAGTAFGDAAGLPVMRIIPAGEFMMGSPAGETERRESEGPQKRVKIARPLGFSVFPLTRSEARMVLGDAAAPRQQEKSSGGLFGLFGAKRATQTPAAITPGDDTLPAVDLSLEAATRIAARLSEATGERYRLPSESEWEYACRAGSNGRYFWGDTPTTDRANFMADGVGPSALKPCGAFRPNEFGLYDMHGNVREWTLDLWHDSLAETPADGSPALGGQSAMNVVRGGSFMDGPAMLRSAARGRATATVGNAATGVRLVREIG